MKMRLPSKTLRKKSLKRGPGTKCPLCGRRKLSASNICGHCITYLEV